MKLTVLYTSVLVTTIGLTGTALAQPPSMQAAHRPAFADFPTPQELARMTPPDPVTEQTIQQRFAKMKQRVEKMNAQDRKEAEKYAHDFTKYQKYQAEKLTQMMERAEQQRANRLDRIDQREQRVLENFRQQQKPRPAQPASR